MSQLKQITKNQFDRTKKMLCNIAKEDMIVQFIDGNFYAFGTELAVLRLSNHYKGCADTWVGYSENMEWFYFQLKTKSFYGEMK